MLSIKYKLSCVKNTVDNCKILYCTVETSFPKQHSLYTKMHIYQFGIGRRGPSLEVALFLRVFLKEEGSIPAGNQFQGGNNSS